MFDIARFFKTGLKNTLLLRNNSGFSHNGPWKQVYTNTLVSRWHNGEFSSAEFTISIDYDTDNKEIIKCLVCNTPQTASLTIYGRNNMGTELVKLAAVVNDSYVELQISPAAPAYEGAKFIYSVNYYHNQNPLVG